VTASIAAFIHFLFLLGWTMKGDDRTISSFKLLRILRNVSIKRFPASKKEGKRKLKPK
jgi:hypothetical protein